jgi:hypothetical protein
MAAGRPAAAGVAKGCYMRHDRNGFLTSFFGLGNQRRKARKAALRRGRVLDIEHLEPRAMLTVIPPALTTNANPAIADSSVTITAAMPATAQGNVTFKQGTTTLGSPCGARRNFQPGNEIKAWSNCLSNSG